MNYLLVLHWRWKSYQNKIIYWDTFAERYLGEQKNNPASLEAIHQLREKNKVTDVTLLCQEYEWEHCHRHLLKHLIYSILCFTHSSNRSSETHLRRFYRRTRINIYENDSSSIQLLSAYHLL